MFKKCVEKLMYLKEILISCIHTISVLVLYVTLYKLCWNRSEFFSRCTVYFVKTSKPR